MISNLAPKSGPVPEVSVEGFHGSYISRLKSLLADRSDIKWSLDSRESKLTKVAYTDTDKDYQINSPQDLVSQVAALSKVGELSICIIENISADYIEVLGTEWSIDPTFFVDHASNPDKDKLWLTKIWNWRFFLEPGPGYLDGVFEYHNVIPGLQPSAYSNLSSSPNFIQRHCFKDAKWPLQSSTRISYCRPNRWLYLFLVDAPIELPSHILETGTRSAPTLRFMNSDSRGGLELPRLFQASPNSYSVFENLKIFCQHYWHLAILFLRDGVSSYDLYPASLLLPSHPLIYLMASCIWEENLRYLDKEIKRISFKELRNPNLEINSELHDRREDLARIKTGLSETKRYIPKGVTRFFAKHPEQACGIGTDSWDRLIDETTKLEAFLMETFQLFMSSVSVQDSRLSINQARRGSQITLLALIYVPLSFITGIFGMNIQQINGSGLNIWVCFVTLVPVVVITVLAFLAVKLYGERKGGVKDGYSKEV